MIEQVSEPTTLLDVKEPTLKEITEVVKKARTGSAPGPNGIPYKVYKMCPKCLRRQCNLLKVIWRKDKVPELKKTEPNLIDSCLNEDNTKHLHKILNN